MSQTRDSDRRQQFLRRIAPAVGLFLLSPLVAEFLLGNIAIDAIWLILFIAPLYGGGAVLIREISRRSGRGWPSMMLLALAYAVMEEGLITQSLFNPSYFGFDLHGPAYIPVLGMGGWWTLYVLTIHTVWSVAVPIALVEAFVPARATKPWLGALGIGIAGSLFFVGAAINYFTTLSQERFLAWTPQLLGTTVVALALIAAAFAVGRHSRLRTDRSPPSPWLVGTASLLATSGFTLGLYLPGWPTVCVWLALFVGSVTVVARWSCREGWDITHRLALAGGALLTYAWQGFPHTPIIGSSGALDLIGNSFLALGAVALLAMATLNLNGGRYEGCAVRSISAEPAAAPAPDRQ